MHFHSLVIDGVYVPGRRRSEPEFLPLLPPEDAEVARVTADVGRKLAKLLERRGLTTDSDPDDADPLAREPLLAALYSASVRGRIATGPEVGRREARLGDRIEAEDVAAISGPRCAAVAGVSVHANVLVPARDRKRLERLCRYVSRPAVATERLLLLPDGRVAYALRHPYRDGTTHVAFEPVDFIGKLAALVPPPRFNMVRYYGVLAAAAGLRADIVPEGPAPGESHHANCTGPDTGTAPDSPSLPSSRGSPPEPPLVPAPSRRPPRARNYSWAELMHRVFAIDALECSACHGRTRIIAALHSAEAIRAILECLGLPSRAPPVAPPVPEPENEGIDGAFDFDPVGA